MISEWFLSMASGFVTFIAGLFGEWTPPTQLTDATGALQAVMGTFVGLGVWVDWGVLGACVTASLAAWAVVVGIKLIRALLAHVPQIGGAGD